MKHRTHLSSDMLPELWHTGKGSQAVPACGHPRVGVTLEAKWWSLRESDSALRQSMLGSHVYRRVWCAQLECLSFAI